MTMILIDRGFQVDPLGEYEMRFRGPRLVLSGPYTISGRILLLPIQGNGYSNFTLSTTLVVC